MGIIKILDETVAGRIAAGEVVERPASIVKELVENSIDAKATSISISIIDGGIRSIRVADNGNGIAKEDMPLTIIKHATSKLKDFSDLEKLYTMGFRGEALFSISAVSMLKITSRRKCDDFASEIIVHGGKTVSLGDAGAPEGTTVLVENLFYNTPARLKFLKKPSLEASAITDLVSRLILSHPEISIKYTVNNNLIYHSSGNGILKDCIMMIYGREAANMLIPLEGKFADSEVSGFIGQPELAYKTKKNGTIFVNNRYIKSEMIDNAVLRGYGERFLKGTHPLYCIKIKTPKEDVDVNVHPNKLFVHFRDDAAIEYLVYNTIKQAITVGEKSKSIYLEESDEKMPSSLEKQEISSFYTQTAPKSELLSAANDESKQIEKHVSDSELSDEEVKAAFSNIREECIADDKKAFRQYADIFQSAPDEYSPMLFSDIIKEDASSYDVKEEIPLFKEKAFSYKYIGSLFNTYALAECGEVVYVIDQHALHERLLYDELKESAKNPPHIHLLLAEVVVLSHTESVILEDNLQILREMGFEIENFGPLTYKINAVPKPCSKLDIPLMLRDILNELSFNSDNTLDYLKDKIARAACKAAVKGGDIITEQQVRYFLKQLDDTGGVPHCPHGRPIYTVITKAQLEKSFKRKV